MINNGNNSRRPYSRQGCRECKRRKIKCPEEKPSCSTCVRLNKTCSYPLAGEKVLRISRKLIREEIENTIKPNQIATTHFLPVQYDIPKRINLDKPLNIQNLLSTETNIDFSDLNNLTNDLNNLVNNLTVNIELPDYDFDFLNDFSILSDEITRNLPIDYIKLKKKHEIFYLESFYNNFANIIEPFGAYHQDKTISNPARDIILKTASTEPFLLAAVLAEGAKTSFIQYSQPEDEKAYALYLSKCLQLLEPVKDLSNLNSNVEAVLLTLILLTAASATSTQQWRPHLNGAKELLIKIYNQNVSKIFIFCKYWFISIEILAGLSTNLGGTLQNDYEIDKIMTPTEYEINILKEMGLVTVQDFNILTGYSNSCLLNFRDLLKVSNKERNGVPVGIETLELLSKFYQQSQIVYIDAKGIIPENELKSYTPGLPIEEIRINNQSFWLSWQDISHQSYVLGSIILILTKFYHVKSENSSLSQLINRILSFITYIHQFQDVSQHASPFMLLMIQWPLLISGYHVSLDFQKNLLIKYFKMVEQIGAATANIAIKMLNQHWRGSKDDDHDTLIY
ncbi:unnamed protein product [Candida verbasci]|uniref:Zn(2)-C6 fungal-type domain-containing protein n=1 Tax=Candida verbasci TaxID=1227364 RepID=A0A9W4U0J0_9ASCO|nr:unnamed protein product [Candida verbasci]